MTSEQEIISALNIIADHMKHTAAALEEIRIELKRARIDEDERFKMRWMGGIKS